MKAKSFLLAISLAANLVLGWMLWQRHPAMVPEPALVQSLTADDEVLPLPTRSVPLTASPLLPLSGAAVPELGRPSPPDARARLLAPDDQKPYGPPLPPNPHAFPPWLERTPYRDSQLQRTLLTNPRR